MVSGNSIIGIMKIIPKKEDTVIAAKSEIFI